MTDTPNDEHESDEELSVWQVIGSVFAAAFGVQSDKNRRRDFTKAKPSTYIIAGIIFTLAFILVLVTVVKNCTRLSSELRRSS